mgnify:CR=1 FL=1
MFKTISAVDLDLWRNDVAHISGVNLYDKRVLPASSASFTPLADNSTLITWQIEKIARTFLSPVEDSWVILNSDVETLVPQHYVAIPGLYETKPFYEGTVPHPDGWDYPEIGGLKSDNDLNTIAGTRLNTNLESRKPNTI